MFKIITFIIALNFSFYSCAGAAEKKWNEERSAHFIIYYKEAPDDFVGRVV